MKFPSFDLTDQVAIVTGAGRGMGRAFALALAHAGAHLMVGSRTVSEVERVAEEVRQMGRRALACWLDVAELDSIRHMVEATMKEFGRIDILVNNAGINAPYLAVDTTEEQWDEVLDINLRGLFFCCSLVGKVMVEQRRGKIINIASNLGVVGLPRRTAYSASKGGVVQQRGSRTTDQKSGPRMGPLRHQCQCYRPWRYPHSYV